jgi:hypothetical protein
VGICAAHAIVVRWNDTLEARRNYDETPRIAAQLRQAEAFDSAVQPPFAGDAASH